MLPRAQRSTERKSSFWIMSETKFPPLWIINHTIPLVDENKLYHQRPSHCPEAFRSQWVEKKNTYLKAGHWEITNASNMIPMLLVIKPRKPGDPCGRTKVLGKEQEIGHLRWNKWKREKRVIWDKGETKRVLSVSESCESNVSACVVWMFCRQWRESMHWVVVNLQNSVAVLEKPWESN